MNSDFDTQLFIGIESWSSESYSVSLLPYPISSVLHLSYFNITIFFVSETVPMVMR